MASNAVDMSMGDRDRALYSPPTKLVRRPCEKPDAQQGSKPYPVPVNGLDLGSLFIQV
ncbi:hypothetical protein BDQ94DRAFT_154753 [Aspergillus welwitschiae]|uniref:Uncharacterized protein n=1 Tax=Aspergillus welwitschiae TaxID=1341132 RepID=A0A3F3PJ37_9EURO|nr:hypothetical protein BDQ94DRAFT_154753 [Aspergillus welwitschiae]RDH26964.1 hypothetical protein BDQ94DRAFT_154753 [Aspergillus welwitschiae]